METTKNNGQFKKQTQNDFIKIAMEIHIDSDGESKYSYDKTIYVSNTEKVIVTCKSHGDFEITPKNHKDGRGCKQCSHERTLKSVKSSKDEFIEKAILVHHDDDNEPLYIYDDVVYVNSRTPVIIICKNGHRFEQTPSNHLKAGCKFCSKNVKLTTKDYIKIAKEIHKDNEGNPLFDYSLVDYKNSKTDIILICKSGHQYKQRPDCHLKSTGCLICK